MEDLISPVIRLDLCILWEKKVFSLRRLIICLNIVSKLSEMSVCVCVCVSAHLLSHAHLFATPWTVARQAPLSMGFLRQEY